jgi:hypothetical protein
MTEQEWLACADPQPMLEFLPGKVSDRKLRLFAVASCHLMTSFVTSNEQMRTAVAVAEQHADGLVSASELATAYKTTDSYHHTMYMGLTWGEEEALRAAMEAVSPTVDPRSLVPQLGYFRSFFSRLLQYEDADPNKRPFFLRCVIGPLLYRAVTLEQSWLTATVTSLATAIYQDRSFDNLPLLADALEDAGCSNQEVLNHLRGGGEHCRGCWPLDLVLGKE